MTALELIARLPDRRVQCGNVRLAKKRKGLSGYAKAWIKGYTEEMEKKGLTAELPSGEHVFSTLESVCLRDQ
jgi:hypothetical protein